MDQDASLQGRMITDQEAQNITRVEELAYELRVQDVMTSKLQSLSPELPMSAALHLFRTEKISGAPVIADGRLAGVISMEDLIRCLTNSDLDATVEKYMSRQLVTVKCGDPVVEALKLF